MQTSENNTNDELSQVSLTLPEDVITTAPENPSNVWSLQDIISAERTFRKNKKITILLTGTRYSILEKIVSEYFTWNIISKGMEVPDDWNIQWYDTYISTETLRGMLPFQKINHFPESHNLGRKNLLAKHLGKMRKWLPDDFDFYPRTWMLPLQIEDLRQFVADYPSQHKDQKKEFISEEEELLSNEKNPKKGVHPVFIVKPEAGCQGRGIFLTKKIENALAFGDHSVVQEYLPNPYLIDGLKFDLRVYVLLKSVQPLKVFVYREGLARFATHKFQKPTKANMKNIYMHLTNYSLNKKNPNFEFNQEEDADDAGHKRSLSSVFQKLEQEGNDADKIFKDICCLIVKTICAVQPHLSHVYRACQPKEENFDMCFEILGFDVLLDSNLKPYLLEVNHTPSFHTDTPLDLQIKKNLILDTLILANMTNKAKKKFNEGKAAPYVGKKYQKIGQADLDALHAKCQAYEDKHLGGFVRAYPPPPDFPYANVNFQSMLETAVSSWNEFTGPRKMKGPEQHPLQAQGSKSVLGGSAGTANGKPPSNIKRNSIPKVRLANAPQPFTRKDTKTDFSEEVIPSLTAREGESKSSDHSIVEGSVSHDHIRPTSDYPLFVEYARKLEDPSLMQASNKNAQINKFKIRQIKSKTPTHTDLSGASRNEFADFTIPSQPPAKQLYDAKQTQHKSFQEETRAPNSSNNTPLPREYNEDDSFNLKRANSGLYAHTEKDETTKTSFQPLFADRIRSGGTFGAMKINVNRLEDLYNGLKPQTKNVPRSHEGSPLKKPANKEYVGVISELAEPQPSHKMRPQTCKERQTDSKIVVTESGENKGENYDNSFVSFTQGARKETNDINGFRNLNLIGAKDGMAKPPLRSAALEDKDTKRVVFEKNGYKVFENRRSRPDSANLPQHQVEEPRPTRNRSGYYHATNLQPSYKRGDSADVKKWESSLNYSNLSALGNNHDIQNQLRRLNLPASSKPRPESVKPRPLNENSSFPKKLPSSYNPSNQLLCNVEEPLTFLNIKAFKSPINNGLGLQGKRDPPSKKRPHVF